MWILGLFQALFGRLNDQNPVQTTGRLQHDASLNCRNPFFCNQLPSSNPVASFAVGDRYPV